MGVKHTDVIGAVVGTFVCGHPNAKDHINTVLKTNATLLTQAPRSVRIILLHTNVPLAPSQLRTLSSDSRAQLVELVRRAAPALRQQSPVPQSTAVLGSGARRTSSLARATTQLGRGLT